MNARQLEAFRAVVVTGSVTQASEMMHISQPAVSRLIGDLEHAAGFKLFDRRNRRLVLRPEGEILYREVERQFVSIDMIARKAAEIRDFSDGELRLAAMPAMSLDFLADVIKAFSAEFPTVTLSFQVRSSQKVIEWIANNQFDIGLAASPYDYEAVSVEPLPEMYCVAIVPPNHQLAENQVISVPDMSGERFISLGGDSRLRALIDATFQKAGIERHLVIESQVSSAACSLVKGGLGVSIVDPFTAYHYIGNGLVVRPFLPPIPYEYALLMPLHVPMSRLSKRFRDFLHDHLSSFQDNLSAWGMLPDVNL